MKTTLLTSSIKGEREGGGEIMKTTLLTSEGILVKMKKPLGLN